MKRKQKPTRPSHFAYVVEGEGQTSFWTKIGSAWGHEDGEGFNLQLVAMPITGRLVIRKARAEQEAAR